MCQKQSEQRQLYWFLLSHQLPEHKERCVLFPLGNISIGVCARCLGLYPTLFVVIVIQFILSLGPLGIWDWVIVCVSSFPALIDWGLSRLHWRGNNFIRVNTGALLGVGLGRSFFIYFRDQKSEIFWVQILCFILVVIFFEVVRCFHLSKTDCFR